MTTYRKILPATLKMECDSDVESGGESPMTIHMSSTVADVSDAVATGASTAKVRQVNTTGEQRQQPQPICQRAEGTAAPLAPTVATQGADVRRATVGELAIKVTGADAVDVSDAPLQAVAAVPYTAGVKRRRSECLSMTPTSSRSIAFGPAIVLQPPPGGCGQAEDGLSHLHHHHLIYARSPSVPARCGGGDGHLSQSIGVGEGVVARPWAAGATDVRAVRCAAPDQQPLICRRPRGQENVPPQQQPPPPPPCAHVLLAAAQRGSASLPIANFSHPPPAVGILASHRVAPPAQACLLHHHHHHHHHLKPICVTPTELQQRYVPLGHGQYVGTPHPAAAAAAGNFSARCLAPLRPLATVAGDVTIVPKAIYWTPTEPAFQSTPEDLSLPRSAERLRLAAGLPEPTQAPLNLSASFGKDAPTEEDDCGPTTTARSVLQVTQTRLLKPEHQQQQRQPETSSPSPTTTESASESLASPLPPLTPPPLPALSPMQPRAAGDCGSDDGSGSGRGGGDGAPVPLRQVLGPLDNRAGGLLCSSPGHGIEVVSRQHHNAKERMRRIKEACQLMRELLPGVTEKTDKATVFEYATQYILYIKQIIGTKYDREFLQKYSPY